MAICFGRFDSEIPDLKKTHTSLHGEFNFFKRTVKYNEISKIAQVDF